MSVRCGYRCRLFLRSPLRAGDPGSAARTSTPALARRQFVRFDNPVYSTNVHEFIRGEDTIFSVFL
jgi:hypothetical protein